MPIQTMPSSAKPCQVMIFANAKYKMTKSQFKKYNVQVLSVLQVKKNEQILFKNLRSVWSKSGFSVVILQ